MKFQQSRLQRAYVINYYSYCVYANVQATLKVDFMQYINWSSFGSLIKSEGDFQGQKLCSNKIYNTLL